jgi:flagellar basal-body rod modification protein FlgD
MMTGVSAATSNPSVTRQPNPDAAKANLDYNSFLRLFIAQMKNQDPTKPNDPTESLSQLASFSNVEQSIKLNEKLDSLVASSSATLAAAMIGKGVSSLDGGVSGVVTGIENGASGLVALLADGNRIVLSNGYKITAP